MPRGKGKRGRGRARNGGGRGRHCDEYITFSLQVGMSANITFGQLSTRPAQCNIRPQFIRVQATAAYVPALANDALAGYSVPAAIEVQMRDSGARIVANSTPQTLGAAPRSVFARYPRSGDWYSYNTSNTTVLGTITAICLGQAGTQIASYVRGIIHIRYGFGVEVLPGTCPSLNVEPAWQEGETWVQHMERYWATQREPLGRVESRPAASLDSVSIDFSFLDDTADKRMTV